MTPEGFLYCFQCVKLGIWCLTTTPASKANLVACNGSCGLLFPLTTEVGILIPIDWVVLWSPTPLVACLNFLALLCNGTTQFSYIQIVRKVTRISNSVTWFIDMSKVVPTFTSLVILLVGRWSLLFGMAKIIFMWLVPHRALFALCVLTFGPSWNYKMLQLCWTSWLHSLWLPSPRTHIGASFCPTSRDFSMACSTHSLKLEKQT